MYPSDRDRDIRELEALVFGGVPETPQPVFERDTYAYSEVRTTRQGLCTSSGSFRRHPDGLTLGRIKLNVHTEELEFLDPAPIDEAAG